MVSLTYLSAWFLYRVWKLDRFRCLSPQRFRQGELKSVVTALILIMIPFQLYYGKIIYINKIKNTAQLFPLFFNYFLSVLLIYDVHT